MSAAVPLRKSQRYYLPVGQLLWRSTVCIATIAALAAAQENRTRTLPELHLPYGSVTQLASPDGSRLLFGVPYQSGINDGPQLWIEDTRTHQRNMLLSIAGTLSAVWSPDGSAFSVQDHFASDSARTYIYDANALRRLDTAGRIQVVDPGMERFASGHAYFDLERWDGAQNVIVRLHGHTDQPPVVCFDLRYRVSRTGGVAKLSQRVFPINNRIFCKE
jgi:hypothetical protein